MLRIGSLSKLTILGLKKYWLVLLILIPIIAASVLAFSSWSKSQKQSTSGELKEKIVFDNSLDIFMMDPDGSHLQQLTHEKTNEFNGKITPDGSKIVYLRQDGVSKSRMAKYDLWIMDANGSNQRLAINLDTEQVFLPILSPDGTKVVYVLCTTAEGTSGANIKFDCDMYVENLTGGGKRKFILNGRQVNTVTHWSDDGYVYFTDDFSFEAHDPFTMAIWRMRPDGSNSRIIGGIGDHFVDLPDDQGAIKFGKTHEEASTLIGSEGQSSTTIGEIKTLDQDIYFGCGNTCRVDKNGDNFKILNKLKGKVQPPDARGQTEYIQSPIYWLVDISPDGTRLLFDCRKEEHSTHNICISDLEMENITWLFEEEFFPTMVGRATASDWGYAKVNSEN